MADPEDADAETGLDRSDDEEGFLARWSRRKQDGYRYQEHPSAAAPQTVSDPVAAADDLQPATVQRQLTDADMPPVDSLNETSDFAAFMSPGISEQLRVRALRKLFHLPGLHTPDGLDDYDEDFTQFAKLGNIVTHEMERMLARERQAADGRGTTSEPGREDVEREVEAVKEDETEAMIAGAEAAPGSEDDRSEQGGGASATQDVEDKEHQGRNGSNG